MDEPHIERRIAVVVSKLGEIRTHFEGLGHLRWKTSTDLMKNKGGDFSDGREYVSDVN